MAPASESALALVPVFDHGLVMFVAENAGRRNPECVVATRFRPLAEPPRREHAENVAVGEEQDVARRLPDLGQHAVDATGHLGRRLAPGRAILPERPAGPARLDLRRGEPVIVTVVPFGQVRPHLSLAAEAGQAAGFPSSGKRAAQDQLEAPTAQPWRQCERLGFPGRTQGNVASTCVPPLKTPGGFPVPHEDDALPGQVAQPFRIPRTWLAPAG
jgi:hypothetical protein